MIYNYKIRWYFALYNTATTHRKKIKNLNDDTSNQDKVEERTDKIL